jgi:hypothetical protein
LCSPGDAPTTGTLAGRNLALSYKRCKCALSSIALLG